MSKQFAYGLMILAFVLLAGPAMGQEPDVDAREFQFRTDTAYTRNMKFLFMPLVYYTPETNIGFGLGTQAFFRTVKSDLASRPSNALLFVTYTLNRQIILEFKPQVYFKNESFYLNGDIKFQVFPDKF